MPNQERPTSAAWLPTSFLTRIAFLFISLGLFLRFIYLDSAPYGFEIDQSVILYWGHQAWKNGKWFLYGPEFTGWEMLPGYYYSLVEALTGLARLGPALWSLLELGLFYFFSRRLFKNSEIALISILVLVLSPWPIYYSRIVGTCSGLAVFWMLALMVEKKWLQTLFHLLGLFYYTAYRAVVAGLLVWGLRTRSRKSLTALAASVLFLAVAAGGGELQRMLIRGDHLARIEDYPLTLSYLNSVWLWFFPSIHFYFPAAEVLSQHEVGFALAKILGPYRPPFGWIFSIFIFMGLIPFLKSALAKNSSVMITQLGFITLASVLLIGSSASYSHFAFLIPVAGILAGFGYQKLQLRFPKWILIVFVLGGLESGLASAELIRELREGTQTQSLTGDRYRALAENIPLLPFKSSPKNTFIASAHGLIELRYLSSRFETFLPLAVTDPSSFELMMKSVQTSETFQLLIFENPELVEVPAGFEEMQNHLEQFKMMRARVETHSQIQKQFDIIWRKQKIGTAYLVKWP